MTAVPNAAPAPAVTSILERIAAEIAAPQSGVRAAVELLDAGNTVPFIARYRKEVTGGLTDSQLRTLAERLTYLRELEERRAAVRASIAERGLLTDELDAALAAAETKARLEDIYLPYKPKRRTKAQIARELGLEPLADALLGDPGLDPHTEAAGFLNPDVADESVALTGARAILVERFAEDADLVGELRDLLLARGRLVATEAPGAGAAAAKFSDYREFSEGLAGAAGHRVLAVLRGEKEGALTVSIDPEPEPVGTVDDSVGPVVPTGPSEYERRIAARFGIRDAGRPADRWLLDAVRWAWRTKLGVTLGVDARTTLRARAEAEAVAVFAANLGDLLLAAPAGARTTLGLDPGYRTGVKVAVVDGTGKVVDTAVVYPHKPAGRWDEAVVTLAALCERHGVDLVAVGNGTASRETDRLAGEVAALVARARGGRAPATVVVSEAGASVYSASEYASRELPGLDVSLRGAVSIARRLQDPLAELVKIDPRSIGVGQYQHDVSETLLARSLDAVVEDAVNAVGVDVNTASVPLLARVSGIGPTLAENIVSHRDAHGSFTRRRQLLDVPRLGPKAFEQCAGFLRITGGEDPLDASAVHPEAYPVVRRILDKTGRALPELIGDGRTLRGLRAADFADERFGEPTVRDILVELDKPGRDPRPEFRTATFAAGVDTLGDLRVGMVLEGTVTNVAAFGAFVDIGVHQDGLVHVSALSDRFVADPREVVRSGQVVRVKVLDVDPDRARISLSLRLDDEPGTGGSGRGRASRGGSGHGGSRGGSGRGDRGEGGRRQGGRGRASGGPAGSMADALRRAGLTDR